MGYLIFRNVSTASLQNVAVSVMPSHKKAAKRITEYYVRGRDGALHVDDGFANMEIEVTLVLLDGSAATRQIVNAWADGTGRLISSDDLTKAYLATVEQEIRWKRVLGNSGYFDTAKITFNCQPYMVEAVESIVTLTATGQILNPGSSESFPLIQVTGSGDASFTFAGYPITIADMDSSVPVYIDCETGYVYTASGAATMTGDIPCLAIGTNTITFTENVTQMVITPRWRWI